MKWNEKMAKLFKPFSFELFKNAPTVAEPLPRVMAASGGWLVLLVASMMCIQVDTVNPLEGGMAQRLLSQRDELIQVKKTTPWLYYPASWFLSIKSRLNIYKTSLIDVQAGLSNITEGLSSPPSWSYCQCMWLYYCIQGVPKKLLTEYCWSHGAQAQSPVADTPCVWKLFLGRFY